MPPGPRKLAIAGRPDTLTRFGGVYLLHRFFSRIGLKHVLAQQFPVRRRNAQYSTGELVLAMLYPIILGSKRLETTRLLRTNGLFQYLTGLRSYPHATTLQRFLSHTALGLVPRLRALAHPAVPPRDGVGRLDNANVHHCRENTIPGCVAFSYVLTPFFEFQDGH